MTPYHSDGTGDTSAAVAGLSWTLGALAALSWATAWMFYRDGEKVPAAVLAMSGALLLATGIWMDLT